MKKSDMKESLHYYDGMAVCIGFVLFEIIGLSYIIYDCWSGGDRVGVILFLAVSFLAVMPISAYMLLLGVVSAFNYKVTTRGIEVYKIRKLRYFLPWDEIQSVEIYPCGVVVSKLSPYETAKLVGDSPNGPEMRPWEFRPYSINSALYTKKGMAHVEEATCLLVTNNSFSRRNLERRLANIRYLWMKGRQQAVFQNRESVPTEPNTEREYPLP